MLVNRTFLAPLDWSCVDVYLYVDASPQSRGWEMLASTFMLYANGQLILNRLLPPVRIAKHFMSTKAKTVALLWQILLLTGWNLFRRFADRARGHRDRHGHRAGADQREGLR